MKTRKKDLQNFPISYCNETVYATGSVNIRAGYTADSEKLGSLNKGDSVTRTGVSISGTEAAYSYPMAPPHISNQYLSTTKPVQQQQSSGGSQQQQQQPQESQDSSGGGDFAADIEARKQAVIDGVGQMFKDNGYGESSEDHAWTDEEFKALQNQAAGDRQILAKQLNISPHQLSYVTFT